MIFNFYIFKFNINKIIYIFFTLFLTYLIFFSTINVYGKTYSVDDIEIIEPYNLEFEKNKVIDKAFLSAFEMLLKNILSSKDLYRVKITKLNEIKTMVDSFSIKDEKFINDNYIANFKVLFDKKKIINYLNLQDIITSSPIKNKIIFFPVLIDLNTNELFMYKDNLFYNKWNTEVNKKFLLNYSIPAEDLEDLQLIQNNILNIENFNFDQILKKYNTDEYIVCIFFKQKNNFKILSKIKLNQDLSIVRTEITNINYINKNFENEIIEKLKIIYDDHWKSINQINTSIKLSITISINSKNLNKINMFEKELEFSDMVYDYRIEKMSNFKTIYKILYNGTPDKFISNFRKKFQLDISKEIWELK